jgi:hypothetical protein
VVGKLLRLISGDAWGDQAMLAAIDDGTVQTVPSPGWASHWSPRIEAVSWSVP